MKQINLGRAILAGIAGTGAMTVMAMAAGVMGVRMDVPAMLSGFMQVPISVGWLAHFMIGAVLAVIYAGAFAGRLPGAPAVRGAVYGLLPFVVAQIAVMPMMGMGLFTSGAPNQMVMVAGSLMGHLVYGAVVGVTYGAERTHGRLQTA